jgi:hypothetical protein
MSSPKATSIIMGCLLLACTAAVTCRADAFEFSAERVVRIGERSVTAHVYAGGDRWRLEYAQPLAGAVAAIVREDQDQAWILFERTKTYRQVPITEPLMLSVDEQMDGEVSRERIGSEELNGFSTELFEVTVEREGQRRQYYQWVTNPQRFAIKTISKDGDQRVEYRHINFAKQPELYFALPFRYRPAPVTH